MNLTPAQLEELKSHMTHCTELYAAISVPDMVSAGEQWDYARATKLITETRRAVHNFDHAIFELFHMFHTFDSQNHYTFLTPNEHRREPKPTIDDL